MSGAILLAAGVAVGVLGALFSLDARDRRATDNERRMHEVLCAGRDCDISPSVE